MSDIFGDVGLPVLIACLAVAALCALSAGVYRYNKLKRSSTAKAVLPLNIDTDASVIDEKSSALTTTTSLISSPGSSGCSSSGGTVRYSFGPNSISSTISHQSGMWSPAAVHTGALETIEPALTDATATVTEQRTTDGGGTPYSSTLNKQHRKVPWAPQHMTHLDTHVEAGNEESFFDQFDDTVKSSFESITGVNFENIVDRSCRHYLCQWVRHVQLRNNALRLQNGVARAVAPPSVLIITGNNRLSENVDIHVVQSAIRYAAELFVANAALRSKLNKEKGEDGGLSMMRPRRSIAVVPAPSALEGNRGYSGRPVRTPEANDSGDPDDNMGYSVKRYYENPSMEGDLSFNIADRTQPHPADLAQLKKQLFH